MGPGALSQVLILIQALLLPYLKNDQSVVKDLGKTGSSKHVRVVGAKKQQPEWTLRKETKPDSHKGTWCPGAWGLFQEADYHGAPCSKLAS